MDPFQIFRNAYHYLDSQVPNFNLESIIGVRPFLRSPQRGMKYTMGEMRLGLATIVSLNCFLFNCLRRHTVVYLKKSFFSTFLLYWLFLINLLGLVPKIITYVNFNKLK